MYPLAREQTHVGIISISKESLPLSYELRYFLCQAPLEDHNFSTLTMTPGQAMHYLGERASRVSHSHISHMTSTASNFQQPRAHFRGASGKLSAQILHETHSSISGHLSFDHMSSLFIVRGDEFNDTRYMIHDT